MVKNAVRFFLPYVSLRFGVRGFPEVGKESWLGSPQGHLGSHYMYMNCSPVQQEFRKAATPDVGK